MPSALRLWPVHHLAKMVGTLASASRSPQTPEPVSTLTALTDVTQGMDASNVKRHLWYRARDAPQEA